MTKLDTIILMWYLDNMGQFVAPFASLGRVTLDRRASSKRPVSISGG